MGFVHSFGGNVLASSFVQAVPEIDGRSLSTGLALLTGGILLLRARRRAK
jgi:hypothetical protein